MLAARNGHVECVVALVEKGGAELNLANQNDEWTALMFAARDGYADCVSELIRSGADLNRCMKDGLTALGIAAHFDKTECIKALVEAGAEFANADGETALNLAKSDAAKAALLVLVKAAGDGDAQELARLLALGVSANVKDEDNNTALATAVRNGHAACVRLLVDAGAALQAHDNGTSTALEMANSEVKAILQARNPEMFNEVAMPDNPDADRKPRFGKRSLPAAATRGFVGKMSFELEGAPGPRHHGGDDKTCRVVGNFDLRAFLARFVSW